MKTYTAELPPTKSTKSSLHERTTDISEQHEGDEGDSVNQTSASPAVTPSGTAQRMSKASEHILSKTSKANASPAVLALEDGSVYRGFSCGASGEVSGELCFNTGLVGYLEVITDPSYAGQIVTMTYPQIGNYGVNVDDVQADQIALRGLVVRDMCAHPSNWRCTESLSDFLRRRSVVAIEGIDTRSLVRHLREAGAMRAVLSTEDLDEASLIMKARSATPLTDVNFVKEVSRAAVEPYAYESIHAFAKTAPKEVRYSVVAYDCGVKSSILDGLVEASCAVTVVPWDTPAKEVLALEPDGVFLSNGPGDPERVEGTFAQVEQLLGKVPLFGICLGHQMLGKAAGASVVKLKYGHRGINQPVMNLITKRVEITVQNHGFNLVFSSLGALEGDTRTAEEVVRGSKASASGEDLRPWTRAAKPPVAQNERFGRIQLTHVNLNDGTIEGMRFLDVPAFSVQYHPEAAPGSTDSQYLFTAFTRLMDGWRTAGKNAGPAPQDDYLAIDIAQDRLAGWKFGPNTNSEKSTACCGESRSKESTAFCGEPDRLEGSSIKEVNNA